MVSIKRILRPITLLAFFISGNKLFSSILVRIFFVADEFPEDVSASVPDYRSVIVIFYV